MNIPLSFDDSIDLHMQRLPARALDLIIQECELNEHMLHELGVNHNTIGQLLQDQGVRERIVILEEAKKLGVTQTTEDPFNVLDVAWRAEENPFVPHVLETLERVKGTLLIS